MTKKADRKKGIEKELPRKVFSKNDDSLVSYSDFEKVQVIGKGAYGKVYLVKKKDTNEVFAMKTVSKAQIIEEGMTEFLRNERNILKMSDHPFLVNMSYVFQTEQRIYFVMRFIRGGELRHHLHKQPGQRFSEESAKFYCMQIALALGHLHKKSIVYRDLKTENVLMDVDGYLCLTDFGLAKVLKEDEQAMTVAGTVEYLAPEIVENKAYGMAVDWWTLGVLTYELCTGFTPFFDPKGNQEKIFTAIKQYDVLYPEAATNGFALSANCQDFISKLLDKNPSTRLGTKGDLNDLLSHPFLKGLNS